MTSPFAASMVVLPGGGSSVSVRGAAASRLEDCAASTAGPPTHGSRTPARRAPARAELRASFDSVRTLCPNAFTGPPLAECGHHLNREPVDPQSPGQPV